jgi:hypothetical protein
VFLSKGAGRVKVGTMSMIGMWLNDDRSVSATGFEDGAAEGVGLGLAACTWVFRASAGAQCAASAQASEIVTCSDRPTDFVKFTIATDHTHQCFPSARFMVTP